MNTPHLILASASPQRKELLEALGLSFQVVPSTVDEKQCPEQNPVKRCLFLSRLKAKDVASKRSEAWVLGCDTLVEAHDGTLLEKPVDAIDAKLMLDLLSGNETRVHSGICLIAPGGAQVEDVSTSTVTFKHLSDIEKEGWINSGLWKGRSGGFQIDGPGQLFIERLEGDWTGVVGLPVFTLGQLFQKAKAPFLQQV
jgi:septum formation protein